MTDKGGGFANCFAKPPPLIRREYIYQPTI